MLCPMLPMEIIVRMRAPLAAIGLSISATFAAAAPADDAVRQALLRALEAPANITRNGDAVRFDGLITLANVEALIEELDRAPTRTLVMDSNGGVTDDGRTLGTEVHRRGLAVHVDRRCSSSCANYVFTAGARRSIAPGAVVLWHVNSLQKDGREWRRCGRLQSSLSGRPYTSGGADEYARVRDMAREHAEIEFFRSIGVDDYIARAGQEPTFFGNFTLSVADMARLGLREVDAPADYGTPAFCQRFNAQQPGLALHCVALTDEMLAYEAARRRLGERCGPDGRLSVRPERE